MLAVTGAVDAWGIRRSNLTLPGLRAMLVGHFGGSVQRALESAFGERVAPLDPGRFNAEAGRAEARARWGCRLVMGPKTAEANPSADVGLET